MTVIGSVPAVSSPMPWQAEDWRRLGGQIEQQQLPHALLFSGPEHTGNSRLALALARLLLCSQPADGLNCGRCHACELSASGNHGDFQWLAPEGKSRTTKVDQIRKIVEFTNRTAGFGRRKVVVFAAAETMNSSAANALLKVLEEPPADTHLILVCHRLHGVPATVRSRCQILRPTSPSREQSLAWLDKLCESREQSETLLQLAGDLPLLAAQLQGGEGSEALQGVAKATEALLQGRVDAASLAAALAGGELDQVLARLARGLQLQLRRLDRAGLSSRPGRAAFALLDEIAGIQRAVNAGSNPNPQLLLEVLMAKVQRVLGERGLNAKIGAN